MIPANDYIIIDFEIKGNAIKLYLAHEGLDCWGGDDWNDRPYEHNAGEVYEEYVDATVVVHFSFDNACVLEPCSGHLNSRWSKDDMMDRRVPMFAVIPVSEGREMWQYELLKFEEAFMDDTSIPVYMGDHLDSLVNEGQKLIVAVEFGEGWDE